jgi:hypothetical protein
MPSRTPVPATSAGRDILLASFGANVGLPPRDRAKRARTARLHLDALATRITPARPRAGYRDRAVLRALVRSFTEPPAASS